MMKHLYTFKLLSLLTIGMLLVGACSTQHEMTPDPIEKKQPSSQKNIIRIEPINFLAGDSVKCAIDTLNRKVEILVPFDTDATQVWLDVTCSPNATLTPASRTPVDYTKPVTYTVKAEDGTTNNYTFTLNYRPQKSLSVNFSAIFGGGSPEAPNSTYWDDTVYVFGTGFLEYKKDEQGNLIQNVISFVDTKTQTRTSFTQPYLHYPTKGVPGKAFKITTPEGLTPGIYQVAGSVLNKEAAAPQKITVRYPNPFIISYPDTMKVGNTITISGKYFTDIPSGNHSAPRLRLYKATNSMTFEGQEFEIISYSSTSVTAKVRGFSTPEVDILQGNISLQVYGTQDRFWVYPRTYKKITLIK